MKLRILLLWLSTVLFQSCFHPVFAESSSFDWKITKTEWSQQDESAFQNFVSKIGSAIESRQCSTVTECLGNTAINPYRKSDPVGLSYRSDCADFPYYLRGYFAWKNGLPFVFAIEMNARPVAGNSGKDIRYTPFGNLVADRLSVASKASGQFIDARDIFNELIPNMTSSANFRTHYQDSNTDFYPVKISRDSIRVGTTLYDPNGHVVMIYKVTDDGRVAYIDAHPDNTVSMGSFGSKFVRSHPAQGAGFKNWRPVKLIGATPNQAGVYLGGRIVLAGNEELADYSKEQYLGNSSNPPSDEKWSQGAFQHKGQELSYYEYVRQMLAIGELKTDPIREFRLLLQDVCRSLQNRVNEVDAAIQAGIDRKNHPERLPENIYGTTGDWESYSTPSRDVQLKMSFKDLMDQSANLLKRWKAKDPNLVYQGANLAQDLLNVYEKEATSCKITYRNSRAQDVTVNLEEIRMRLFKLSFDPYHCVEHRWGAITAAELSSCQEDPNKKLWYEREQRLRNQTVRLYEVKTNFSLDDLLKPLPGNGVDSPPDVNVPAYLSSQI